MYTGLRRYSGCGRVFTFLFKADVFLFLYQLFVYVRVKPEEVAKNETSFVLRTLTNNTDYYSGIFSYLLGFVFVGLIKDVTRKESFNVGYYIQR